MKTQTRKEERKIAFWVSLDAQGIGLIGCSGEGLKLDRGKVRLGAELPTGARLGSSLSLPASCPGTWPPSRLFIWKVGSCISLPSLLQLLAQFLLYLPVESSSQEQRVVKVPIH